MTILELIQTVRTASDVEWQAFERFKRAEEDYLSIKENYEIALQHYKEIASHFARAERELTKGQFQ